MPVYSNRRRSPLGTLFSVIGVFVLAVLSTVGVLWGTGLVDLAALWQQGEEAGPEVPEGMVMVPTSSRDIPAYSRVGRDDMWDTTKGEFTHTVLGSEYVYLGLIVRPGRQGQLRLQPSDQSPAEEAGVLDGDELTQVGGEPVASLTAFRQHLLQTDPEDAVRLTVLRNEQTIDLELTTREYVLNFSSVTGRVLDGNKRRGYAFREVDFLPENTREGLAAGIPPGKRGLTFEADKLVGVHGLRIKDRVDLVANVPIEQLSIFDSYQSTSFGPGGRLPYSHLAASTSNKRGGGKKTEARVLTKEAVIVTPVTGRPVPETDTTVFGTTTRNSSVQQITIAVDEDDVPTVTEAVAAGLTIQCVAISGVPPGEKANEPPEGMVAVPVSGRTVSANSRITRDDLIDPRTGKRRFVHLPAETLEQRHIIADPHALPGRVLRDDKPAGEIFLIEDLAPPGTAEGLAGALPPGRRSFALEATRLAGAHQLRRGDHVDILASLDLKLPSSVRSFQVIPGRTEIRVIVQDAIVLAPLGARDALAISEDSEPALQLILGIRPEEVSVLTQALSRDAGLRAVFRSRRDAPSTRAQSVAVREPSPGDHNAEHDPNAEHDRNGDRDGNADTTSIPDLASLDDAKLMVTQVGNERQTWVFLPDESAPLNGFGQTVDHGALPDEAAPDEAAPVKAAPVKAAPVKAAPDDTAPVKAAPVKTAQGDAAQGGALPDRSRDKTARTRSPAQSWESGYVP